MPKFRRDHVGLAAVRDRTDTEGIRTDSQGSWGPAGKGVPGRDLGRGSAWAVPEVRVGESCPLVFVFLPWHRLLS